MNCERLFGYLEPGGERGEIYEWFTITETELRAHWVDYNSDTSKKISFEQYLTDWLNKSNGYEITDSYPYEEEDEDTRGHA
jgi:hypothetical protein